MARIAGVCGDCRKQSAARVRGHAAMLDNDTDDDFVADTFEPGDGVASPTDASSVEEDVVVVVPPAGSAPVVLEADAETDDEVEEEARAATRRGANGVDDATSSADGTTVVASVAPCRPCLSPSSLGRDSTSHRGVHGAHQGRVANTAPGRAA